MDFVDLNDIDNNRSIYLFSLVEKKIVVQVSGGAVHVQGCRSNTSDVYMYNPGQKFGFWTYGYICITIKVRTRSFW